MRIWKSILLGILLITTLNNAYALATILTSFSQLVEAVEDADDVKAIVFFDKCLIQNKENQDRQNHIIRKFDGASTRFNFTEFLHTKERANGQSQDSVTTSIKMNVEQPSGELWKFFGQLSVFDDNTAVIHIDYFDENNHKKQLDVDWFCNISNGSDKNGLVLYDFP